MATERVTTRDDGAPERVVERETYVDRSGGGVGGVIIGIAVLALVAIVAFFLLNANRNDALRTNATTSAAASVANSADSAARDIGKAADSAATSVGNTVDNATPPPVNPAPAPSSSPPQ
jgi:hypothetical protein